jgi:hypothetical protein
MSRHFPLLALLVSVVAFSASEASALPISPIDPTVGVRGGESGSPPVTDGSAFELNACTVGISSYFCAPYETDFELFALDMSFWDVNGLPIPSRVPGEEGPVSNYFPAPESDFQLLRVTNGDDELDEFTVRLCAAESPAGQSACGFFEIDSDPVIPAGSLFVFSDQDGFVSIRAVNTVSNQNLPDNSAPLSVPEPSSLVLLASGLVAAYAFRSRS